MDRPLRNLHWFPLIPLVAVALIVACNRSEAPQTKSRLAAAPLNPADFEFIDLDVGEDLNYPRQLLDRAFAAKAGPVRLPAVEHELVVVTRLPGASNVAAGATNRSPFYVPRKANYGPHVASEFQDVQRLPAVEAARQTRDDISPLPAVDQNAPRPDAAVRRLPEPELADAAAGGAKRLRFWSDAERPAPRSVLVMPDLTTRVEAAPELPVESLQGASRWSTDAEPPMPAPPVGFQRPPEAPQRLISAPIEEEEVAESPEAIEPRGAEPTSTPAREPEKEARHVAPPALEDAAMRAVEQRARDMNRHAFMLAQRGAHFSARAELIQTLRMISQALDAQSHAKTHSEALASGLRAIDEASDFLPEGTALEAHLDMQVLVDGHRTPVLKDENLAEVTSVVAAQRYLTFAQEQLAKAAGHEKEASAALYGLGRLQLLMSKESTLTSNDVPRAMVYHQAAVTIDPTNYKAANELGVLLARFGQYEQARDMLMHSVRVMPLPQSWQNLATVHVKLGENDLARRATYEARLAAQSNRSADAESMVRWVPATAMASAPRPASDEMISTPSPREGVNAPPTSPQERRQNLMNFLPWRR